MSWLPEGLWRLDMACIVSATQKLTRNLTHNLPGALQNPQRLSFGLYASKWSQFYASYMLVRRFENTPLSHLRPQGHIVTMTLLNSPKMALGIITPTEGKKTGVMGRSWPSFHKAAWLFRPLSTDLKCRSRLEPWFHMALTFCLGTACFEI